MLAAATRQSGRAALSSPPRRPPLAQALTLLAAVLQECAVRYTEHTAKEHELWGAMAASVVSNVAKVGILDPRTLCGMLRMLPCLCSYVCLCLRLCPSKGDERGRVAGL